MELLITFIMGGIFFILGFMNMRGDISTLHSYHRHRVAEEDKKPMGKTIGIGMFIMGVGVMVSGVFFLLDRLLSAPVLSIVGAVIMVGGIAVGAVFNLYGIIKYNKGLF